MSVKTKSIYEAAGPEDGVRVLITRYYPRGVKKGRFDQWVTALSPSRALLSSYRSGEKSWDRFSEAFVSELLANPKSLKAIQELRELSQARDVTLLCYEKPGIPCHRYLVRDIVADPSVVSGCLEEDADGEPRVSRSFTKTRAPRRTHSARIHFYSRRKVRRKAPK